MFASPFLRCLFVLAMLAGSGPCGAARVGELLVKEGKGGMPCFTIPEAEEARSGTPDFHSIMVNELGGRAAVWRMEMPAQRTFPVTVRMCIPYAGRVPVLPQTPAAPLVPGTIYEVAINARSARPQAAPRDYRARFCLILNNGVLRVKNIDVATARQRAVCE
jgi:hypothetical protein